MISQCANPDCSKSFDYQQGRFFRFPVNVKGRKHGNGHSVQHFWLCRSCSEKYTLEYRSQTLVTGGNTDCSSDRAEWDGNCFGALGGNVIRLIPRCRLSHESANRAKAE